MIMDIMKKLDSLSEDSMIVEDLEKAESLADAITIFSRYGIEITEKEFIELCQSKALRENGELNEMELEDVAGGCLKKLKEKIQNWAIKQGTKISHNLWYPNDRW